MLAFIWMCSLVSIMAIASVVYFKHQDQKDGNATN